MYETLYKTKIKERVIVMEALNILFKITMFHTHLKSYKMQSFFIIT